jgi:ABC-type multidrug transport system ATPase subunit
LIRIRGLSKSYGANTVLSNVSADLVEGDITFLMGKNGAGKTTLLKAMLGLEAYRGDVFYDGGGLSSAYGRIGVVYDDAPVYRRLSGYQNIGLLCARRVGTTTIRRFAGAFFRESDLRRKAGTYSYGQRKKLAIAIALLGEPEYLLMDEASSGLDYETMEWLKQDLKNRAPHTTILLTGHQFDFYESIVDRLLLLKDGHLDGVALGDAGATRRRLGVIYETALRDAQG